MGWARVPGDASAHPGKQQSSVVGCWDGQERPGHIQRVIYPSGPAQSRAISTLSSLSKPRHCPGPGLSTGAACKETWKPERMVRMELGDGTFGSPIHP